MAPIGQASTCTGSSQLPGACRSRAGGSGRRQGAVAPRPPAASPAGREPSLQGQVLHDVCPALEGGRSLPSLQSPGLPSAQEVEGWTRVQLQGAWYQPCTYGEGFSLHQPCRFHCSAKCPLLELGKEHHVLRLLLGWKIKLWQQLLLKGTRK